MGSYLPLSGAFDYKAVSFMIGLLRNFKNETND